MDVFIRAIPLIIIDNLAYLEVLGVDISKFLGFHIRWLIITQYAIILQVY